ncbi:MAG TPA: hypothetical protein VII80_02020 [Pseudolabrys sp.]
MVQAFTSHFGCSASAAAFASGGFAGAGATKPLMGAPSAGAGAAGLIAIGALPGIVAAGLVCGPVAATQFNPKTILQTATTSTAEYAMNDFARSDSDGTMAPSQRQHHTAGSTQARTLAKGRARLARRPAMTNRTSPC